MAKINKINILAMLIMAVFSLLSVLGFSIAGISIIVGVVFFFIKNILDKDNINYDELNIKMLITNLKTKTIWIWVLLPLVMNIICLFVAKLFLPEYIKHLFSRTEIVISFNKIIVFAVQLAVMAIGEEIAWRAFFQKQLNRSLSKIPTILITAIIFTLGHISVGGIGIVIYDLFFILINSIIYGVIFYKTNNALVSGLSHFIANLFAVIVIPYLL